MQERTENQNESTITSMCTATGTRTHTHTHTHTHMHSNQYNIQVSLWDALKPFRANEPAISVEWAYIFWKRLSAIKRKACHMNVTYLRGLVLTDSSHLAVWNNTQDNYWQQAWVSLWPWDNSENTWKVTEVKQGNQSFTMKVKNGWLMRCGQSNYAWPYSSLMDSSIIYTTIKGWGE